MRVPSRHIVAISVVVFSAAQLMRTGHVGVPWFVADAQAAEQTAPAPIGYGGPRLRLFPMMVPYRTSAGVLYQPLIIEVELATGSGPDSLSEKGDAREKQACFALPIVHEKLLMYLFGANLVSDDFVGERRDVLTKNLFDVLIQNVGRGYYASLTLVADDAPPLDPKSESLSKQCR